MASFYGWGSTASRLEPLRGDSLLFTTKFPETTLVNQTAKNRILLGTCSSTDPQSNIGKFPIIFGIYPTLFL